MGTAFEGVRAGWEAFRLNSLSFSLTYISASILRLPYGFDARSFLSPPRATRFSVLLSSSPIEGLMV